MYIVETDCLVYVYLLDVPVKYGKSVCKTRVHSTHLNVMIRSNDL